MKTLYFIRHGETLLNLLNRSQGWADSPLTDNGIDQAETIGQALKAKAIHFDSAYTSDSGRARQTAHLILNHSDNAAVPLNETEDLREISFGSCEAMDNHQMWAAAGEAVGISGMSRKSPIDLKLQALAGIKKLDTISYAEDADQIHARIDDLVRMLKNDPAAHILLVSHSLMICCILHAFFPEGLKIDRVPNASVTKIRFDGNQFFLDYIGRTENL
ncbi:histidine phosphatase family protein [Sporolactobacillus spathodeae]|uniref:phosphoglycerate mutase (2,3-diphosphoglycerate-dependent) n=1 Tax=Sporolactobacillus spathodeae TaxID=1465502 RepID=A0ABS2Q8V6_9BACL|nr:histidine phosphatase family protein [Sporolactobacillus spathodeae]MBM7658210.1 putative phosphoglycerate mutase [Sporolactobacillus spathodeae]